MLEKVKVALRLNEIDEAMEDELNDLIEAAQQDLGIAGVVVPAELDAICRKAVITYCKMSFGLPEDYDKLKKSYDEQKAQLSNASGYTEWAVSRDV